MITTVGVRLDCSARWGIKRNEPAAPDRSPAGPQCSKWRRDLLYSQLTQGLDTDSFGATAGSLLGAFFGPGYLAERWLAPSSTTTTFTRRWRGFTKDGVKAREADGGTTEANRGGDRSAVTLIGSRAKCQRQSSRYLAGWCEDL